MPDSVTEIGKEILGTTPTTKVKISNNLQVMP